MESLQSLKSRMKAVRNIGQITKAMEVVAATKMRKSQEVALHSRPYAFKALELLSVLGKQDKVQSDLMATRSIKNTLLVIVTSDRGLAGSFNSQVLRIADSFLKGYSRFYSSGNDDYKIEDPRFAKGESGEGSTDSLKIISVGKKAISYATKKKLNQVGPPAGGFSGFGDVIKPEETNALAEILIKGFLNKEWDRVMTISTHFRSTLKQEVLIRQVLPLDLEKIQATIDDIIPEHGRYAETEDKESSAGTAEYIFEPSPKEIIEGLIDHLLRMQIYHLILEANASEHSARMVAMKTASDNAKELSDNLNLEYNKARQAGITKELTEITAGVNALQ